MLNEDTLVASTVADGHGEVYTDFAIHADGFSRMVLLAGSVAPRRLGRLVQRLLEIDTYRMAALLGLPAAREAAAVLAFAERELAELAGAIRVAGRHEEPQLLDRLTKLAGQVESQYAATHSRFSASSAYFELVDRRIADISETRLAGLQTIGEFMDRRLTPARATCEWATRRQDALSQRVSRISNLLRTRVEIEQQQSSQALLATMNTRQGLQLKLQATVEGLSVAAITYYIVGLVSYLAKGAHAIGWPWSAESTAAVAIPVVALACVGFAAAAALQGLQRLKERPGKMGHLPMADPPHRSFATGLAFALAGSIAFSGKAIIVKLAYRYGVDAVTLIMYRMLFALPIFAVMAWWASRGKAPLSGRDWLGVVGLGVTGYYLSSFLDFAGLQFITASLERLIVYLTPTLVLVLGWFLYRTSVRPIHMLGMAISYCGALLVFGHEVQAGRRARGAGRAAGVREHHHVRGVPGLQRPAGAAPGVAAAGGARHVRGLPVLPAAVRAPAAALRRRRSRAAGDLALGAQRHAVHGGAGAAGHDGDRARRRRRVRAGGDGGPDLHHPHGRGDPRRAFHRLDRGGHGAGDRGNPRVQPRGTLTGALAFKPRSSSRAVQAEFRPGAATGRAAGLTPLGANFQPAGGPASSFVRICGVAQAGA